MKRFVSILAVSALTAGLVVIAAPANARACGNGPYYGNLGQSAANNSKSTAGQDQNYWSYGWNSGCRVG